MPRLDPVFIQGRKFTLGVTDWSYLLSDPLPYARQVVGVVVDIPEQNGAMLLRCLSDNTVRISVTTIYNGNQES